MNVRLTALVITVGVSASVGDARAEDAAQIVWDGRDRFTLLEKRLVNRQLFEQLQTDAEATRLGRGWKSLALASNIGIGTQQTPFGSRQSRFHGYFVFDNFLSVRPVYGLDANVNLTAFNPSASDGYRISSTLNPGANLHFYYEHELEPGLPARFDLVAIDLDQVTLGTGLLIEELPLEGVFGSLGWCDYYLRYLFAGRVFWNDDDLESAVLGWSEGKAELGLSRWKFSVTDQSAYYVNLSSRWPFAGERLQLRAEGSLGFQEATPLAPSDQAIGRVDLPDRALPDAERPLSAALLRADYQDELAGFAWHLGYQFRWYEQGYAPRGNPEPPTVSFNLPYRQESYVTNSFEYFGTSQYFHQWSHSVMLEGRAPIGPYFGLVAQAEWVHHTASDPATPDRVLPSAQGDLLPGLAQHLWYRTRLELRPWPRLPHRLSAVLTNKQVEMANSERTPVLRRFAPGDYLLLTMETEL